MKWIVWVVAALVALVALMWLVGMVLPRAHVAAVRIAVPAPPSRVFDAIADVSGSREWRSNLEEVEIVSAAGEPLRWRETTGFGTMTMALDDSERPSRLVTRIDDPEQPFGGRWIFELAPEADSTAVTITEEGEVYNPFFRFMSRFIFGHYGTLESYARDLARHFGGTAEPVRLRAD